MLLLLATAAHAGSITLTVPDEKDAIVIEARDLYNARTGQELTTKQFVMQALRRAITDEIAQKKADEIEATVEAAREAQKQLEEEEAAKIQAVEDAQESTTWGLPATPKPTPQPTPTVPALEVTP
jgi:seryl-tRNA synthetase